MKNKVDKKSKVGNKSGPWSAEEKRFISDNANKMSVQEISEAIKRNVDKVSEYIRKNLRLRIDKDDNRKIAKLSSGTDIEKTMIWDEIKKELDKDELNVFLYHWNRIIIQFKEDVFPTEEMQIIDTIKLEILMSRSLKAQKAASDRIMELKEEIIELKQTAGSELRVDILERQLIGQQSAYELMYKEYNDLLSRKSSMLKELKGTRDQRLKRIEDSKATFTGWVNELLNNNALRKELGLYIEKFRIASEIEKQKLSKPIVYLDGETDVPLLTPENIINLQKEEDSEQCEKQD